MFLYTYPWCGVFACLRSLIQKSLRRQTNALVILTLRKWMEPRCAANNNNDNGPMFELWAGVCAFASRNPSTREISHSPLNAVQPTTHAVFPSYV